MPDAQDDPRGTESPPRTPGEPASGAMSRRFGAPESGDDTPTMISRQPPTPARAEDVLQSTLRGRRLAHFEILGPVGIGGMAAVLRARDVQLDRVVALKVLPPEVAAEAESVARFQHEARAAARLDHENIARVYYGGEDQGLHFIAFEFVEGETLRALIERQGRLSVGEAVGYALQVAHGLAHAAARGVVHRDVKPSNVIITPEGRAKLVDMGLARSAEGHHDLTQSGMTLGSFDYISPEQALEPRDADVRSDIYSLGCTFYHALTGRPPVPDGTAAKKLHHHQQVEPPDPRSLNAEIPREVADVLSRMMAKDPARRYQAAGELVADLTTLAHHYGERPAVPGLRSLRASAPRRRRRGTLAATFTLAAAAIASIYAFRAIRDRGPSQSADAEGPAAAVQARDLASASSGSEAPAGREPFRRDVTSAAEFADALAEYARQKPPAADIRLAGDIDLSDPVGADRAPGLVLDADAGRIVVAARDGARRPTVRFTFDPIASRAAGDFIPVRTGLTVRGGTVVLRDLRFEVNAGLGEVVMAAVRLQEEGHLSLQNCEFVQVNSSDSKEGHLSSVMVDDSGGNRPKILEVSGCYFGVQDSGGGEAAGSGQVAVTVGSGPATVKVNQTAFAPHAALFRLRGAPRAEHIDLNLRNCSAFLVGGCAFQVAEGVYCRLDVQDCIFSRPTSAVLAGAGAALIQQAGDTSDIRFDGYDNRYHNLTAFWLRAPGPMGAPIPYAINWDQFQHALWPGGADRDSRVVSVSPWADKRDPLQWLRRDPQDPARAFRVDPRLPEMRQTAHRTTRLVGVENGLWGIIYDGELPPLPEPRAHAPVVEPAEPSPPGRASGDRSGLP